MKKLFFAAIAVVCAAAFTSCGNGTKSAKLETDEDTLSYALGIEGGEGLKMNLQQQMGIDSTQYDEFIKGFNEGFKYADNDKKRAYCIGIAMGLQMSEQAEAMSNQIFAGDSTKTLSKRDIVAGVVAGLTGKKQMMTVEQAQKTAQQKMQALRESQMSKAFGPQIKKNEAWLAANAKKEGVKVLPSGLQYKVITEGTGATPTATSVVKVNYEGKLIDGTVFDSSYKRGEPAEFRVNGVIPGWAEALTMMKAGSKWEIYIPAKLGYNDQQMPNIPPFSTLIFTVELLEVK